MIRTLIVALAIGAAAIGAAPAVASGKYANCTEAHQDGRYDIPRATRTIGTAGIAIATASPASHDRAGITTQMVTATIVGIALSAAALSGAPIAVAAPYSSCSAAEAAGAAPLYAGQPGYSTKLDRDRDGVACESGSGPVGVQLQHHLFRCHRRYMHHHRHWPRAATIWH